ncbi:MAG: hypothetical protein EOO43_14280 [Flavobacterium sp.]|nr:MAG: hypothetical protein EOO43_14280 [Flavobacterium sp.]
MDYKMQLQSYAKAIIKDGDFHDELAPAITNLAAMLYELGQIDSESEMERNHIVTDNGSAIGVFWAAQCIKEVFRTQRFTRGLYVAVNELRKKNLSNPVHILYAGTGPFATLALPIMTLFSPQEVQFTLLEINPESYRKLTHILSLLKLNDYVKHSEIADATTWKVKDDNIDIVVSETMNRALIKEPQVSIMLNLCSQIGKDVIYIPEEISVNLAIEDTAEREVKGLKNLVVFNKEYMFDVIANSSKPSWDFEQQTFDIEMAETTKLQFLTNIKVYQGNYLNDTDCSLNIPERLKTKNIIGSKRFVFQYSNIGIPGFKWTYTDI